MPLDLHAHFFQAIGHRDQVIEIAVFQFEFAIGNGGGDDKRAEFDAVGDDPVLAASELIDAFDLHFRRAFAGDFRAHFLEHIGAVDHFRLAGGADEDGFALSERGSAHDVNGAKHGRPLSAAEVHAAALEALTAGDFADDVTPFGAKFSAELLKAPDVKIHGAIANCAATGDGDLGASAGGNQGPQNADRSAHRLDDVIAGMRWFEIGDFNVQRSIAHHMAAQFANELDHGVDVGKPRHAMEARPAFGHQTGCHNGQRGVLAPGDFDFTFETCAAADEKALHDWPFLGREACKGGGEIQKSRWLMTLPPARGRRVQPSK